MQTSRGLGNRPVRGMLRHESIALRALDDTATIVFDMLMCGATGGIFLGLAIGKRVGFGDLSPGTIAAYKDSKRYMLVQDENGKWFWAETGVV
jgi:hypothetical protein